MKLWSSHSLSYSLQRNYHFDFLRKQHPLFSYFTKLVEQYTKIINPQKETLSKFRKDLENPFGVRALTAGQQFDHCGQLSPGDLEAPSCSMTRRALI